jgi:type II secretory pathway pseudopilin PulG
VLFILGILATVVVVNVVGLTGRGEAESYASDAKTIQLAVYAFYADVHVYSKTGGWNETAGNYTSVHNYPTRSGNDSTLYLDNEISLGKYKVRMVMERGSGMPATSGNIADATIWMGLLTNSPGDGEPGIDRAPPGDSRPYLNAPLAEEAGPYLNPLPQSCSIFNIYNGKGSIVWIIGEYGKVYGVFQSGDVWYAGYGGKYP